METTNKTGGEVDLLSAASVLTGTPSGRAHEPQVRRPGDCSTCLGCGEVGVTARTHEGQESARCSDCNGTGLSCPNCGEGHTLDACTWVPTCRDCDASAAEVSPGVRGKYCEECTEIHDRIAAREQREADYEAHCESVGDAMREGGW